MSDPNNPYLRCAICGDAVGSVGEAIDADWIPSFWCGEGDDQFEDGPACPACCADRFALDASGEFVHA